MKRLFTLILLATVLFGVNTAKAAVSILETKGWYESGYVTWTPVEGAAGYNVYVRSANGTYTKIDNELVRDYGTYGRADMVGLAAGNYQFKVVPVVSGAESAADASESAVFTAVAHDRAGFAHQDWADGVGAYKNDGTLKDGARVIYVTANNAKTVELEIVKDSKGTTEVRKGLQNIIQIYEKGYAQKPLAVRIIGCVKAADMDEFGSSAEGLQVKGKNGTTPMNLTIEGIGDDATIHGFGILARSTCSVEFRNFGVMICLDDCLSLDTDNKHCWIHNMDFFYGGTGSAADQAKGDGTVDVKGKSSYVTVSFNHFFDSGKSSLGGMKSETTDCVLTYHHNWFDHSDSRHPRIRTMSFHIYNNYFDGNAKYGVGMTMGGSAFVEKNYFRNCKYPMLISKQGTDATGDGTFSGEAGGVIKSYDNYMFNPKRYATYKAGSNDWDAYEVQSAQETVPSNVTCASGGTGYNNFDTNGTLKYEYTPDAAQDVKDIVMAKAGRLNGGDFKWQFNNAEQDENYGVIAALKSELQAYKSSLVGFFGTSIKNGGYKEGDRTGGDAVKNENYVAGYGGAGSGTIVDDDVDFEEEAYIANADGTDYFWFNESNEETVNGWIADGTITLTSSAGGTSAFVPTYSNITYKKVDGVTTSEVQCETEVTGSLQLSKASAAGKTDGGSAVFYCKNGVTSFKLYTYRTGSAYYEVQKSTDGTNFTTVGKVEKGATGILQKDFTNVLRNTESTSPVWVRVINTSTGGLNIQGVLINQMLINAENQISDLQSLKADGIALNINDTYMLTKGVDYATSSTGALSYATSKATVATVDANGVVKAISEGTAVITISQAKDDVYRAGSATITINVTDPRQESALTVTSNTSVTLKENETSAITVTGAAGAVTYVSNNTDIATVDAQGNITAVGLGSAVITITDAGSASVKPGTATVQVNVVKDMTGVEICHFTDKKPSSPMVTVSGNYSNSKGSVTYGGVEYVMCVKMESATDINITPSADCTVTLVFGSAEGAKRVKVDGETCTTDANGMYEFSATGGNTVNVKKGDSINLFLVIFTPNTTDGISEIAGNEGASVIYDLMGRKVMSVKKGQTYIVNGKKYINK